MITEAQQLPPVVGRYDSKQLAAELGLSTFTLQRYRSEGGGPAFEKIGNRIYYRIDVVEEWRQSTSRTSTSDVPVVAANADTTVESEDLEPQDQQPHEPSVQHSMRTGRTVHNRGGAHSGDGDR